MNDLVLADRAYFLKEHVRVLSRLNHSISQVVVVDAESHEPASEYVEYLRGMEPGIIRPDGSVLPVKVMTNKGNVGGGYGSWILGFEAFRDGFTDYIIFEDDYIPTTEDFDRKLSDILDQSEPKAGYVCGEVQSSLFVPLGLRTYEVRLMPIGLITHEAFEKVYPDLSKFIRSTVRARIGSQNARTYGQGYARMQLCQDHWGATFRRHGIRVIDVRNKYRVRYVGLSCRPRILWPDNEEQIVGGI